MVNFNNQVERNVKGKEFEKSGFVEEAINLYEMNLSENFEGNYPYDRLVIIYKKKKDFKNVIRVLESAIFVFEKIVDPIRADRIPKLNKFKQQLEKLKK